MPGDYQRGAPLLSVDKPPRSSSCFHNNTRYRPRAVGIHPCQLGRMRLPSEPWWIGKMQYFTGTYRATVKGVPRCYQLTSRHAHRMVPTPTPDTHTAQSASTHVNSDGWGCPRHQG